MDNDVNNEEKKDLVDTIENNKTEEQTLEDIEKIMLQVLEENKRRNKFMKYLLGMAFVVFAIVIYFFIYWLSIVGRIFI